MPAQLFLDEYLAKTDVQFDWDPNSFRTKIHQLANTEKEELMYPAL